MNKNIKRCAIILLLCCMMTACKTKETQQDNNLDTEVIDTQPDVTQNTLKKAMTKDEYPRVDGSTATIPLSEAVFKFVTGASEEEAQSMIVHTKTSNAYYRLMNKEVDLLIVYEPSEEVLQYMSENGQKLNLKPIGKDALVFMANASNEVDSLTKEQLIDIYSGKIVNWSKVGGKDQELLAFQRPAGSGSQTLMQKLVMGDTPMAEGSNVLYYSTMEGILEAMAEYNNEGNTLGYSVFYYAKNMYQLPELKFMKVNGIEPSLDSIYDNTYPFINEFYAVIREDEPVDSKAHAIFDWLTDEEGQSMVKDLGYVPIALDFSNTGGLSENTASEKLPNKYQYVAASYTDDGFNMGTVTIYKDQWRKVKIFQNAQVSGDIGLLPDETLLSIGLAIKQEDGTWNMRYGLYSLQENAFILPTIYASLRALDAERGYYIANNTKEYQVINRKGEVLASGFYQGEGLGVYQRGDYYWINGYTKEADAKVTDIYDINFCFIKRISQDFNESALYYADGTPYFTRQMFLKQLNLKDEPEEYITFYTYDMDSKLISVDYNGKAYILDRDFNIIAVKDRGDYIYNYYYCYGEVFSDTVYNKDYIENNTFYDRRGNLITNKQGDYYTNIVYDNYWYLGKREDPNSIILYRKQDNKLSMMRYHTNEQYELDINDWDKVTVRYMYGDISVVQQVDGDKTRIYNKETLIFELDGLYDRSPLFDSNKSEGLLLVDYGADIRSNRYIFLDRSGNIKYQSSYKEEILSIDENYIQLDRGNYAGIMNYNGKYYVKTIKTELNND